MSITKLKQQAQLKVCACYYYDLANEIDNMTAEDLQLIIDNPYYCHTLNDDEVAECPEYQTEQAEVIRDGLREDGINA